MRSGKVVLDMIVVAWSPVNRARKAAYLEGRNDDNKLRIQGLNRSAKSMAALRFLQMFVVGSRLQVKRASKKEQYYF